MRLLAAALLLVGAATPAAAAPDSALDVAQLRACALAAGIDNPRQAELCEAPLLAQCDGDYARCYDRLLGAWEALMAASLEDLARKGVLERDDAADLRASQRAWARFRSEDCAFYSAVWPGARPPYQRAACRHRMTRERATILTVRLEAARRLRDVTRTPPAAPPQPRSQPRQS
ncbi:MAG: lysozyme inhibitor LprI family protein [Hyphomonadaceae bacterium]|nr:lysozyme inhibitor LprI family protein [Hyphomonadaceae bacterium]